MSSTNFIFDGSKVQIVGNVARLIVPVTSATILSRTLLGVNTLDSVSESVNKAGTDNIKYHFLVNSSTYYWFNGTTWVVSDQSFAQSNSVAEINAAASSFISTVVGPGINANVQWEAVFAGSGTTSPELVTFTVSYESGPVYSNVPLNECYVYCYLRDLLDVDVPLAMNAKLVCVNDQSFVNNGVVIARFTRSVSFASDGTGMLASMKVIQTNLSNKKLRFMITYEPTNALQKVETIRFRPVMIPAYSSIDLAHLTTVDTNQLL